MGQAMSGMFVGDEVMKGTIASAAFEAMEVASYEILIATAEEVGDMETKRVCEEILREEEAMETWLKQNTPLLTRQYLAREHTERSDGEALKCQVSALPQIGEEASCLGPKRPWRSEPRSVQAASD